MANAVPKYKSEWIKGDEVFAVFDRMGFDRGIAIQWLQDRCNDHKIDIDAEAAKPDVNLFRLPRQVRVNPTRFPVLFSKVSLNSEGLVSKQNELGKIDWQQLTIVAHLHAPFDYVAPVPIEVSRELLTQLLPNNAETKHKGGAPEALDWIAIEDAIRGQVKKRGMPDLENPKGWRRKGDVEKFVANLISDRGDSAATSTIRTHVTKILNGIKSAGN